MGNIGIMQPYFLPYLGYFGLIKYTDRWVIFDTPQFIRHGWIERNRILKPGEGWQYIKIPLNKHPRTTPINEVSIKTQENWQEKILAQLGHYKKRAPFYHTTINFLKEVFSYQTNSIVKLNAHLLQKTCEALDIKFNYAIYSEMNLKIESVHAPDEWALNICKALNITHYINPPLGMDFFDIQKYKSQNVTINFLKINLKDYDQKRPTFESGLSIIDVMMFNTPEAINQMLDNYELL